MENETTWKMPSWVGDQFAAKVVGICGGDRELAVSLAGEDNVRRYELRTAEEERLAACRQRLSALSDRFFSGEFPAQDAEALLVEIEGATAKLSAGRAPAQAAGPGRVL